MTRDQREMNKCSSRHVIAALSVPCAMGHHHKPSEQLWWLTSPCPRRLLSLPMAMGFYRERDERETKCGASRPEAKEWCVTSPKESIDARWSIAWEEDGTRSRTDGSGLGLGRAGDGWWPSSDNGEGSPTLPSRASSGSERESIFIVSIVAKLIVAR
jgi:hypothetical protein